MSLTDPPLYHTAQFPDRAVHGPRLRPSGHLTGVPRSRSRGLGAGPLGRGLLAQGAPITWFLKVGTFQHVAQVSRGDYGPGAQDSALRCLADTRAVAPGCRAQRELSAWVARFSRDVHSGRSNGAAFISLGEGENPDTRPAMNVVSPNESPMTTSNTQ